MNWFKNQKIAVKLTLVFSIAILGLTIITFMNLKGLSSLSEGTQLIARDRFPKTIWSNEIIKNLNVIARSVRNVLLWDDPAEQSKEKDRITKARANIDLYLDSLKQTIKSDKGKNLLNKINEPRQRYIDARTEMFNLLDAGDRAGALKLLFGDVRKSQAEYMTAVENIANYQNEMVKAAGNDAEATFNTIQLYSIISSVFVIIIVCFITYVTVKGIVKPVKAVKDQMVKFKDVCMENLSNALVGISKGDLSVKVDKITGEMEIYSKDEIGEMAMVYNEMIKKVYTGIDAYEVAREKIRMLSVELNKLTLDAKNGLLDNRSDANKFAGAYKEIILGLNQMLDAIILPVQDGSRVLEVMATGDFRPRITAEYLGQHKVIQNSINRLGDSISEILRNVTDAVQAVTSASNEISSSTEEMAAGSQEQSSQTAEVASAVEQMTRTIVDATKNSSAAADAAKHAGAIAKEGGKVVNETKEGMSKVAEVVNKSAGTVAELGKSSVQIGEIIQVIDDIADQTNLLALNAAIEAARAGDQGRGFAVVADEVRKLAERTTKATKEIASMIRQIQAVTKEAVDSMKEGTSQVEKGKDLADKAGKSLEEIISGSADVVDMVAQVAAANEEQSSAAEQISRNIEGINNVTHESSQGIQQIARASEDLSKLTLNLQDLILKFKIDNTVSDKAIGSKSAKHLGHLSSDLRKELMHN